MRLSIPIVAERGNCQIEPAGAILGVDCRERGAEQVGERWSRLITLREDRKLSQTEVARAIGMSRSGFSMYELGEREPDMDTVRKLADYFNVTTDYLLGRTEDPKGGSNEPIPPEWRKVIAQCRSLGLSPDQVLRALGGLTIISEALSSSDTEKDRG